MPPIVVYRPSWRRIFSVAQRNQKGCRFAPLLLMSFKGMRKSIRIMEASTETADASPHLSDEFPAGYSLTGCSPALPASASPAGVDSASEHSQVRGPLHVKETMNAEHNSKYDSGQVVC
jgi:hypothetical protein